MLPHLYAGKESEMREIEVVSLGRIQVPDEWTDKQIKQHILGIPKLTIDWQKDEAKPVVMGDTEKLQPIFGRYCVWSNDGFWRTEPRHVETIRQLQRQLTFRLVEILPKADPPSGGFPAQGRQPMQPAAQSAHLSPPENPAAQGRGSRPQSAPAPAAELLLCKIERSIAGMSDKTPVRDVTVLTPDKKKPSYRCYNKDYFEAFDKGVGQEALLVLKRNKSYTNIERPLRIGSKTWDEHGVVEIQKDREAGQKTLYP